METVAFLVQRIGPYHHARLCAWTAARPGAVKVIEFRPGDTVYAAWGTVEENGAYARRQTCSREELCRALDELQPRVVVCVGYADPEIHQAMAWALRKRVPLITCSDSTFESQPRSRAKEVFKRLVLAPFDAALVAGHRSHAYLESLGLGVARRFQPWDVVDNAYFERGADASRLKAESVRAKYHLPPRYFLCVARFIPEKKLERLVEAYAHYVALAGRDAWSLVLPGSGPLETQLRASVAAAGLEAKVQFPGFLHYQDLPAVYGLAGAFVFQSVADTWGLVVNEAMAAGLPMLVSSRCGCAPDLVREGGNGFVYDPENVPQLAGLLTQLANMNDARRAAMGQQSREMIKEFSPEAFAQGMEAAIACVLTRRRAGKSWFIRMPINLLARRSPPNS